MMNKQIDKEKTLEKDFGMQNNFKISEHPETRDLGEQTDFEIDTEEVDNIEEESSLKTYYSKLKARGS